MKPRSALLIGLAMLVASCTRYMPQGPLALADVIAARARARVAVDDAIRAGAEGVQKLDLDYAELEARFLKLNDAVEKGDTAWVASRKTAVLNSYLVIESTASLRAKSYDISPKP